MEEAKIEIRRGDFEVKGVVSNEKLNRILDVMAEEGSGILKPRKYVKRTIPDSIELFDVKTVPSSNRLIGTSDSKYKEKLAYKMTQFLINKKQAGHKRALVSNIISQSGLNRTGNSYDAIRKASKSLGMPIIKEGRHFVVILNADSRSSSYNLDRMYPGRKGVVTERIADFIMDNPSMSGRRLSDKIYRNLGVRVSGSSVSMFRRHAIDSPMRVKSGRNPHLMTDEIKIFMNENQNESTSWMTDKIQKKFGVMIERSTINRHRRILGHVSVRPYSTIGQPTGLPSPKEIGKLEYNRLYHKEIYRHKNKRLERSRMR